MSLAKILVFSAPLKTVTLGTSLEQEKQEQFQKGYQAASDKFNAQLLAMRQEMQGHAQGVLNKIEESYQGLATTIAGQLPELIAAGVCGILGEAAMEPKVLKSRIEKLVTESCPTSEPIEVQLHVDDLESLKNIDPDFIARHSRLSFKANENLARGDCVMQTKFGQVDARIKTQISRLIEELIGV